MTTWNYIIGSEKDFECAPDEVTIVTIDNMRRKHFGDVFPVPGAKYWSDLGGKGEWGNGVKSIQFEIIAQREPVATDDSKYNRPCKGITIDVYDVLKAFNVTCPALQHLIKKALAVDQRGHKDAAEDLRDILASAKRAIELSEGK